MTCERKDKGLEEPEKKKKFLKPFSNQSTTLGLLFEHCL